MYRARFPHPDATLLLEGVVGSTAYGLARPGSDQDILGVYAEPLRGLLGLNEPAETVTEREPDGAWHEARKYARLALSMNPTITELMWLDETLYTHVTDQGAALIGIRDAFLSAQRVKDAYLGYAVSQFKRLQAREDGSFSSDTRARSEKHARHMARLIRQGRDLYTTGALTVNVSDDADWYFEFGAAGIDAWIAWFTIERARFENAPTVLPDRPDTTRVEEWLLGVRSASISEFTS